jgi:hypothetical protein
VVGSDFPLVVDRDFPSGEGRRWLGGRKCRRCGGGMGVCDMLELSRMISSTTPPERPSEELRTKIEPEEKLETAAISEEQ